VTVVDQIRLVVVEDVPQVASHMRALLQAQSQIKMLDVVTAGEHANAVISELHPDVVIVDALLQGRFSGEQVVQQIRQADPQVGLVLLSVPQHEVIPDPARGIDAVLMMPFSGFDLTNVVRKTHEKQAAATAAGSSLVVSLFSPKGGVGRTTLAYNLAVALGVKHHVCLVDGSLQFSDLRGLLRVPDHAPSILNLPTDRVREADLAEAVWKDNGIDILLAPPRIEMAEMVTERDIENAIGLVRQVYELVVIDTRAALSEEVLTFLDASDLILQVLAYDAMAIRSLAMADETFAAIGYPPAKIRTVVNRSDSAGGYSRSDLRELLGREVDYEVVSDGRLVLAANNEGVPFVLASPDAPISQGVRAIADSVGALLGPRAPALTLH
jgi:pilus assembly protein CpaE